MAEVPQVRARQLWRRLLSFGSRSSGEAAAPAVLVVTVSAEDHMFYTSLREQREWNIVVTQTVPEALCLLGSQPFPIIVCDRDLPGWDWRDALTRIVARAPGICFLLTSRVSDDFLWREVVMLGGYDILTRPLATAAVTQTLQRALYYWQTGPRSPAGPSLT